MYKPTDTVGIIVVCIKTVSVYQRSFYQGNSDVQGNMRIFPDITHVCVWITMNLLYFCTTLDAVCR